MTGYDFWLRAARWGSYINGMDPGACMYGFNETGRVQSEGHREDCINWLDGQCRLAALSNDEPDVDAEDIDELIAYLRTAPICPT